MGLAGVLVSQGKYDDAIKIYQEVSTDTKSQLPVDGVLMQLGRAYMKAGKKNEAAHAFTRVVEEFPQSLYAADARREMEEAKKKLNGVRCARERELPDAGRGADERETRPADPFAADGALRRRHRVDVVQRDDRALVPAHVLQRPRDLALLDQEQARRASAR